MDIKVHNFITEGDNKQITLEVLYNSQVFIVTKDIPVVSDKTTEQYVADALAASQTEINSWKSDIVSVGKKFNSETGSFI